MRNLKIKTKKAVNEIEENGKIYVLSMDGTAVVEKPKATDKLDNEECLRLWSLGIYESFESEGESVSVDESVFYS